MKAEKKDYRSVEISYTEHWQNHLVNALRTAYGKSPFYEFYDYRIEPLILKKQKYLWDLNLEILELCLKLLHIDAGIQIVDKKGTCAFSEPETGMDEYYQVFASKTGFVPDLSIFDLLFNEGMDSGIILFGLKK